LETKKPLIFLNDDCDWCKETKKLLDSIGADYVALDVRTNPIAKAVARKACDGREVCMLLKGEVITKFDKRKIADAILD
jgi:arsenate reductase-like glutaredoxin family protein